MLLIGVVIGVLVISLVLTATATATAAAATNPNQNTTQSDPKGNPMEFNYGLLSVSNPGTAKELVLFFFGSRVEGQVPDQGRTVVVQPEAS